MSERDEPHDAEYGLVMPFVACKSNGGPHDDGAFVSGYECGHLDARLEHERPDELALYLRSDSVAQVDLIAMHRGYTMTAEPWDEHPEDYTYVALTRQNDDPAPPAGGQHTQPA